MADAPTETGSPTDVWANVLGTTTTGGDLVPVAPPSRAQDRELRRGDVDGWGRSERMRALARRLYDPVYRCWFRVEWGHAPAVVRD